MINVCLENIAEYGRKRENFSINFEDLDPKNEKNEAKRLHRNPDHQRTKFNEETQIITRYIAVLTNILATYKHLPERRRIVLKDFLEKEESRYSLKTLWILATDLDD